MVDILAQATILLFPLSVSSTCNNLVHFLPHLLASVTVIPWFTVTVLGHLLFSLILLVNTKYWTEYSDR